MAPRAQAPRRPKNERKLRDPKRGAKVFVPSNGAGSKTPPDRSSAIAKSQRPADRCKPTTQAPSVIHLEEFGRLIELLRAEGYEVIGPTVRDGAITYEPVNSSSDLPAGWTDEQEPARYRLKKSDSPALFGYSLGAQSWKRYLHPPEVRLWAAERQNGSFRILNNEAEPVARRAMLGVRACELAAIAAQDRVLLGDKYRDPVYADRRENTFIISVQCTHAAATCFCASVGTGPKPKAGFDLLVTELADPGNHRFVIQAGSERGTQVLAQLNTKSATEAELQAVEAGLTAASQQQRKLDTPGLKDFLYDNFENPQWDKVAARCLSCANCTMACPTCFCTTVEDVTDVGGTHAERWRRWDSCFTQSFSYIHGGSIRTSGKARYRQWMTHKLAAWSDQFGSLGCVGCGRCITWCPAGIDITEEVRAMREGGNRADS